MNLDEVRTQIDAIDTQMKQLFLDRMGCARHVAEAKIEMGSDSVFVLERELAIIEKLSAGIEPALYESYVTFIRHLLSVSRRYQYGLMDDLRENAVTAALADAGYTHDGTSVIVDSGVSMNIDDVVSVNDSKGTASSNSSTTDTSNSSKYTQVKITFTSNKKSSDLNLFISMARLNNVAIDTMNLHTENGIQKITLILDGNIKDANMRQYLAQVAKEADGFQILELI